ncbi:MAG: hypothetical protein SPJ70_06080 [Candidatus Borkfalkiaceae bacterium]|nr:hypothetical protein [Christensenellaceae bacterium]
MKINATLTLKQPRITVTSCEVSDVIELPYKEYSNLTNNLLADREYLAGRTGNDCCLIILCENSDDGLLVDTQDYAYPRYSAFLPKARTIIQDFVQTLADYVVSEGMQNSEDGKWEVSNDELYYHFGANVTADNAFGKMLEEELKRRCEIESAELTEDGIEYEVKLENCENLREEPENSVTFEQRM